MKALLPSRRAFLRMAAGAAALALPALRATGAAGPVAATQLRTERVETEVLDIACLAAGPGNGRPVVLVHDFGDGADSFARVAPLLAAAGLRVLAPNLRGHGATRFLDAGTPRSGQQAALGQDLIDLIDAQHVPEAVFAGVGWGAHAAHAATVLRPTRCVGLLLAGAGRIDAAGARERYLHASDAGRKALRLAAGIDNPDYVAVVTHAWLGRHAPGHPDAIPDPRYDALERKFGMPARTATAAITLEGAAGGAPETFAGAVLRLVRDGRWRT